MFWSQFKFPVSAIDSLLAKDDCTLAEVLDDEMVLQECKGDNKKLLDFLVRQDVIEELVSMVTEEPSDDMDERQRFKHPNVACELLSCESAAINERLISDEALMDRLWSFMDNEPPFNTLLASFFSRVMLALIRRETDFMFSFLRAKEDCINRFLEHIDTSAIMDLPLGLVRACNSQALCVDLVHWLQDTQLLERLVDLFRADVPPDKQRNASYTLCDMLKHCYGNLSQFTGPEQVLALLENDDLVQRLLKNIFSDCSHRAPFIYGIEVLTTMLVLQQSTTESMNDTSSELSDQPAGDVLPVASREAEMQRIVSNIIPWLCQMHKVLMNPPPAQVVVGSVGSLPAPFGPARLAILKLIVTMAQAGVADYEREVVNVNLLNTVLDLFFEFSWNNFLHSEVKHLVEYTLSGSGQSQKSLVQSLLIDSRLMDRLGEAGLANEDAERQPGGRRRGYMGHVVDMSNMILRITEANELVSGILSEIPSDSLTSWKQWVDGPLAAVNEKNVSNTPPPITSIDDSDNELPISSQSTTLQQAFMQYQMQHLATEFVDSFGFNDEEYNELDDPVCEPFDRVGNIDFGLPAEQEGATMFEECCAARIQQFGEFADETADVWEEKELQIVGQSPPPKGDAGGSRRDSSIEADNDSDDTDDEEVTNGPVVVFPSDRKSSQSVQAQGDHQTADPTQVELNMSSHAWTAFGDEEVEEVGEDNEGMVIDGSYKWGEDAQPNAVPTQQSDGMTGWASFANFDSAFGSTANNTAQDSVSTAAEASVVSSMPDNDRQSSEVAAEMTEEVSTSDSSDDSDERDGSYSFVNDDVKPVANAPANSLTATTPVKDASSSSGDDSDEREGSYSFGNEEHDSSSSQPDERHQPVADGLSPTTSDGNADNSMTEDEQMEAVENYNFLSKGGFLSSCPQDDAPVEDTRAKAQAALAAYEAASGLG